MWQLIEDAPTDVELLLWVPSDILPAGGLYEVRKLTFPREDRATHWMTLPPRPSLRDADT